MKEILLILFSYVVGILFFDTFLSSSQVLFELICSAIVSFSLITISYQYKSKLRPVFSFLVMALWFCFGGIQFYFQQQTFRQSNFENRYTIQDELIIRTTDVSLSSSGKTYKVIGEIQSVIQKKDTVQTSGKALFYLEKTALKIESDQLLICTPVLTKIANKNNPGEFDAEHYWNYQGIHYQSYVPAYNYTVLVQEEKSLTSYFLAIRNKLAAIIDTYLTGQEAAVAKGLILGDRTSIEAETTRMFGNTGVMHILAVSGMHVAILVLILNYILQRFPKYITKKQAVIISLTLVWFYSLMTGFSASVARAAWMFTLISGSTLLERRYFPVNGLLFSALIILIINPFAIYDIGFQLSYAAMIGIYTFYPYLKNQLYFKNKWIRMTWEGIALSIAAQLITTPLAIYYFHQFPNYFLLTNIALSAYSLIILSLGLALFISNWWTLLGKGVGFILFWVMFSMLWIIQFIDALPQSVSEGFVLSGWVVFLLYGLIAGMHWSLLTKKIIPLATILTLALVVTAFVVVNRFNNMNAEHLIVFNDANMIVGFKNKERLCVIYDSKRVKKKQLDQLITAYRKIYPSSKCDTIAMHYQKKVSLSSKKHSFSINYSKGGYELNVQDKRFFLATNSRFTAAGREVILSPTIDDAVFRHQLKKGAFMFPLE